MIEKSFIEECIKGNLDNFRIIVEKSSPFVYSVAFRMLGDEEEAKDIVQDTMITVWEKITSIKESDGFMSWIYRIAINKCYDRLRKNKAKPEFRFENKAWDLLANRISENEISELENHENARIMALLTRDLSPRQKAVFILSEIEQLTNEEIVKITGMNSNSVKANLYYARKRIKVMIRKYLMI